MNIELKLKYKIGQRISKTLVTINNKDCILEDRIVSNIKAIYDFKTQSIQYEYELKFIDSDYITEKVIL